ncbi:MAG: Coq4 family protein [Ferruginibacter sp.]
MALPLLRIVRKPEVFAYSESGLEGMDSGTLGNDLFHFLKEKKLQLLPYYAKHDIKHILLEYDTTDEGEVCLQCFMLGNGHLSFPVAATVLYGFLTMPEYWTKFRRAYRRGKRATSLHDWEWLNIMQEQTTDLKDKIFERRKQPGFIAG